MDRRHFLTTLSLATIAGLAGCSTDESEPTTTTTQSDAADTDPATTTTQDAETTTTQGETEETTEEETTTTEEETAEAPDVQTFEGSGAEVREGINIQGGITVVTGSHDGESNFQVKLAGGEYDAHFINVIGQFDGAQADLVGQGDDYILDVNADGNWTLEITQPRATTGTGLPTTIEGQGPSVHGPIEFGGTGVAAGSHDGESNFQAVIYPAEGDFGEHVFNEIGEYSGETSYSLSGLGWVDVNADGAYSIDFK